MIKFYDLLDYFLEYYAKNCLSPTTFYTYRNYINKIYKKYIPNKPLKELNLQDFNTFLKKIKNVQNVTQCTYIKILKRILNFAVEENFIKENPLKCLKTRKIKKIKQLDFTKKDIKRFLKAFKKTDIYLIVLIAFSTRNAQGGNIGSKKKRHKF